MMILTDQYALSTISEGGQDYCEIPLTPLESTDHACEVHGGALLHVDSLAAEDLGDGGQGLQLQRLGRRLHRAEEEPFSAHMPGNEASFCLLYRWLSANQNFNCGMSLNFICMCRVT